MNSGATAERVYDELKAHIMRGLVRPGERLDPAILARSLLASVTPVRDALNRLTGEGLVDTRPGGGFQLPPLDEPALQDRYAFSSALLMLALRNTSRSRLTDIVNETERPRSATVQTRLLFLTLIGRTGNAEMAAVAEGFNDRMEAIRIRECQLLDAIDDEIEVLSRALRDGDNVRLRRLIRAYHLRRHQRAADIVRALYRGQ